MISLNTTALSARPSTAERPRAEHDRRIERARVTKLDWLIEWHYTPPPAGCQPRCRGGLSLVTNLSFVASDSAGAGLGRKSARFLLLTESGSTRIPVTTEDGVAQPYDKTRPR